MSNHLGAALVTAALLAATVAPAEAQRRAKFIGLSAGATYSQLHGQANQNFSWGGTAGLFVGIRPTGGTVTTVEANWIQKGGADTNLDYIEIPVTVGIDGPMGGSGVRGRLYSGISFGFKVSCSTEAPLRSCDNANSTEWAWPFGVQIGRRTQDGRLVALDVRYSVGMSRAFSGSGTNPENRVWQLKLVFASPRVTG